MMIYWAFIESSRLSYDLGTLEPNIPYGKISVQTPSGFLVSIAEAPLLSSNGWEEVQEKMGLLPRRGVGISQMKKELGQDDAWQKQGLAVCLRGWEAIEVGKLESTDRVSSWEGLSREAVGTTMEKGTWTQVALKPGWEVYILFCPHQGSWKTSSRAQTCWEVLF